MSGRDAHNPVWLRFEKKYYGWRNVLDNEKRQALREAGAMGW